MTAQKGNPVQHRTARRFAQPSPLFRWADASGYLDRGGNALVFGAGLLAEAEALLRMGWRVDALETAESVSRRPDVYEGFEAVRGARVLTDIASTRSKYGLITATHVLEFVEDPSSRLRLLQGLADRLSLDGYLLLSLRGWSDVRAAKKARARGDGVVTGLGTWTRGYTTEEAEKFIAKAGLEVADGPRSARSKTPEQVRLLCRRK